MKAKEHVNRKSNGTKVFHHITLIKVPLEGRVVVRNQINYKSTTTTIIIIECITNFF